MKGAGLAGLAGLAGCIGTGDPGSGGDGGDGSDGSDESDGGNGMASEINVWGWDVAARALMITSEEYESENDATVAVEEFGRSAMKDRLQTNLLSGSGAPAVSMLESVDGPSFIDTGSVAPLTDEIEEAGVQDDFVSGKWEALTVDGDIYALPWDTGPTAVYYRRSVYDEHDIDPDSIETWEEFIEEGQKLPDDQYMLNLPEGDLSGVWRYQFRQLSGEPFLESGEVNIHNEKSLRVARNIKEIYDADIAANIEGWTSAWFSAYGDATIASLPSAAWMEGTLRAELPDTAGDWGVFKIPALESGGPRASNWGGSNLMIADQVSDEAHARGWDYMEFSLATKEMQLAMYDEYGLFPALETTYDDPVFDKELDFYDGQPARALFAEVAQDAPGYRFTADTPEVSQAIETELQRMINGEQSPEEAVQAAAETVAENTDRDLA
ncbi:sugar ABC transporter substrate-binding protein [Halorubrum ezzemoulense]|uniref:sugar ABC transporter substrate-binding protein n=1 Tax=Halorubrum ezzemoulense TaxID=337243 RepID=UPI00232D8510|nr:extracellular solute-binding protein [Halorubrum ezzemoulense]MDB2239057.1 extracellular solute-binding protein [Halorubrum ezzemoulense]MDB2249846.1 extracellular solute-binding protein [Halorubrum ezzemoulense]